MCCRSEGQATIKHPPCFIALTPVLTRNCLIPGYDWVHQNQVQWYIEQSRKWQAKLQGEVLPALAFLPHSASRIPNGLGSWNLPRYEK